MFTTLRQAAIKNTAYSISMEMLHVWDLRGNEQSSFMKRIWAGVCHFSRLSGRKDTDGMHAEHIIQGNTEVSSC